MFDLFAPHRGLIFYPGEEMSSSDMDNPLSAQDQEFYNFTLRLLDASSQIRPLVKQRLQKPVNQPKLEHQKPTVVPAAVSVAPAPTPGPAAASAGPGPGYGVGHLKAVPAQVMPVFVASAGVGAGAAAVVVSPLQSAPTIPEMAFGRTKWVKYFGHVGPEPPLPPDIHKILKSRCPFWPDKAVEQTHTLTLIPKTVNGQPFTPTLLGELVKAPKGGGHAVPGYRYFWEDALKEHGGTPVERSYWVLMPRDVIPGSSKKAYSDQVQLVASYSQKIKIEYRMPNLIDTATSVFMVHADTGVRLLPDSPCMGTRCLEATQGRQLWVGGFGSPGLSVASNWVDAAVPCGAVPVRKF